MEEYYFSSNKNDTLLEVKDLRVSFSTSEGILKAVRGLSYNLKKGETLALVGESGCGKSVSTKSILGVLPNNKIIDDGQILYDGQDLLNLNDHEIASIRGSKIAMIFQDPLSALNPIVKIGKQLEESYIINIRRRRSDAKKEINRLDKALKMFNLKYSDLYKDEINSKLLLKNSYLYYIDYLKIAYEKLTNIYQNYFSNIESFDYSHIKNSFSMLFKEKEKFQYPFYIKIDNQIENEIVSLCTYIKNYQKSIFEEITREELFQKYGVKNYYDLDIDIKKKTKEIICRPYDIYNKLKQSINNLIFYLNKRITKTTFNETKYIQVLHRYYEEKLNEAKITIDKQDIKKKCLSLLNDVGIDNPSQRYNQYPFELSGGMRQRVVIAISLSLNPEILICDEPTTALDVTIQAQILSLINNLKKKRNLSLIFITHDLGVVANVADEIAIMYAGKIVEYGTVYDIFYDPRHPYTWSLLSSIPDLTTNERLESLPSMTLDMHCPNKGDAFAPRNKYSITLDYKKAPPRFNISPTHYAYTWLLDERAKDVNPPEVIKNRIRKALKENINNKPLYVNKKNSLLN